MWVVSPHVRTRHLKDGTAVLLDTKKGVFCKLNAAGSRIWRAIDSSPGGAIFESVVTALESQNANVHREKLEMDVSKYLDALEQMELVHRRPYC
jgi:Coenzyme PQQ synthesis protein D (PqqD)